MSTSKLFVTIHQADELPGNVHINLDVAAFRDGAPATNEKIAFKFGDAVKIIATDELGLIEKADLVFINVGQIRGKLLVWAKNTEPNAQVFRFDLPQKEKSSVEKLSKADKAKKRAEMEYDLSSARKLVEKIEGELKTTQMVVDEIKSNIEINVPNEREYLRIFTNAEQLWKQCLPRLEELTKQSAAAGRKYNEAVAAEAAGNTENIVNDITVWAMNRAQEDYGKVALELKNLQANEGNLRTDKDKWLERYNKAKNGRENGPAQLGHYQAEVVRLEAAKREAYIKVRTLEQLLGIP